MQASLARDYGVNVHWIGNQAGDTFQNAYFSSRILRPAGVKSILLVTSSTHMWRASHEFTATGLEATP